MLGSSRLSARLVWFLAGLTAVSGLGAALRRRRVTAHYSAKPRPAMNGGKGGLLVVGLNPAQQSILRFDDLRNGGVNRATKLENGVGGKGQNAAKAAAIYLSAHQGKDAVEVTSTQFVGGETGETIQNHLTDLGIMQISGITGATTRKTVTLIDYQAGKAVPEVTELISPSGTITQEEIDGLYEELVACAPNFGAILLMGTWPKGVTRDFYAGLAAAKGENSFVLLDAFSPQDDILSILLDGNVDILKVNAYELCILSGIGGDAIREGEVSAAQVADASAAIFEKVPGLEFLAVTDGPNPARVVSRGGESTSLPVPTGVNCVNPIGAGDTVAGVTCAALCLSGGAPMDHAAVVAAMSLGLAAASAKCECEGEGGTFELERMESLLVSAA